MIQLVAVSTLPCSGRPLAHKLAEVHCYLAIQMPYLDNVSTLTRLRFTENESGLLVSGPLDTWINCIYSGCQITSSHFDLQVFNRLHQEVSDLGADFPFKKRHTPEGFYLCKHS
jgi:hypothetical protein